MDETNDVVLPELPHPYRKQGQQINADGCTEVHCDLFCSEQTRAYARQAVLAERAEIRKLCDFLEGREPLEGVWFGEPHPTERGMFWWRKYLRAIRKGTP